MIRNLIARAKGGINEATPAVGSGSGETKAQQAKIKSKAQRGEKAAALLADDSALSSFTAEQFEALYKNFTRFGTSRSGFLAVKEVGPFLRALGDFPRTRELLDLAALIDADGQSMFMDFPEVCLLVSMRSKHRYNDEQVIEAFVRFDPDRTGSIRCSVFRGALQHLAGLTDDELDDVCKEAVALSRGEANRRRDLELAKRQAKEEAKLARARRKKELEEAKRREELKAAGAIGGEVALGSDGRPPAEGGSFLILGVAPSDASGEDAVERMFSSADGDGDGAAGTYPLSPMSASSGMASPMSPPAQVVLPSGFTVGPAPVAPLPPFEDGVSKAMTEFDDGGTKKSRKERKAAAQGVGGTGAAAAEEADPLIYYEVVVRTMFSY
jgi:Ca2+-binding EF-hand superfamily protein